MDEPIGAIEQMQEYIKRHISNVYKNANHPFGYILYEISNYIHNCVPIMKDSIRYFTNLEKQNNNDEFNQQNDKLNESNKQLELAMQDFG